MRLKVLEIYRMPTEIAEEIWLIVIRWDYFCKESVGEQLVRAADSLDG